MRKLRADASDVGQSFNESILHSRDDGLCKKKEV